MARRRTRASVHNLTYEQLRVLDSACESLLEDMQILDSRRESLILAREKVREAIRVME